MNQFNLHSLIIELIQYSSESIKPSNASEKSF